MATATTHQLSSAGTRRLAAQLLDELNQVNSSAAPAAVKTQIQHRITHLSNLLISIAQLMDQGNDINWGDMLQQEFTNLKNDMANALGAAAPPRGLCKYTNPDGSFICTKLECDELGGEFFPGP